MDKIILHCDLNNFYASVECRINPSYKGVPLAVAGDPELRHGVILAKNELAKKYGVKTGDVIWQAKQKAPNLVVVKPHFETYMMFSKQVFEMYQKYTCFVEPFGADECWLDVTGCVKLFGNGKEIADKIRADVFNETGLTLSVGVSFNKVFAKLGSDLKKPNATTEISRENYQRLIYPLPVSELLFVGKSSTEKLLKLNIHTIGELANANESIVVGALGINGLKIIKSARGEDTEGVREAVNKRKVESVGHGMTAIKDIASLSDASSLIFYLSDMIASRLRRYEFRGYGVSINIRNSSLKSFSRQTKLELPTCSATEIGETAFKLLKDNWNGSPPLRTITISVFDLVPITAEGQLSMFSQSSHLKNDNIEKALDHIRDKYGHNAIVRGNLVQTDFIYDKTEAEDFLPFQK